MIIYKESLGRLYTGYIEPILSGEQDIISWWDLFKQDKPNFGNDTIDRCSYDTYNTINNEHPSLDKSLSEDGLYFFPNSAEFFDQKRIEELFFNDITDIMSDEYSKEFIISNAPMYYRSHKEDNGFLGWHTNCKYPEDRWYFVYNTDEHSSFLRYIKDGKMITKWEPQGWSLNHFTITDCTNPFWHCVYTNSHRFSFGIRPKIK